MAPSIQKVAALVQFFVRLRHHDSGCDLEDNAEFVMWKMRIAVSYALQVGILLRTVRKHRGLLMGRMLSYCLFWLALEIIEGCYGLLVAESVYAIVKLHFLTFRLASHVIHGDKHLPSL